MMPHELEWAERIAVLESQMQQLSTMITTYITEDKGEKKAIKADLEELLSLKYKGVGAFWLASSLFGTGIITGLIMLVNWIKDF